MVDEETKKSRTGANAAVLNAKGQALNAGTTNATGDLTLTGLPIGETLQVIVHHSPDSGIWAKDVVLRENPTSLTVELNNRGIMGITLSEPRKQPRKPWWRRLK